MAIALCESRHVLSTGGFEDVVKMLIHGRSC